uniref:Uncharacterized protein LOC117369369 isoform X2 n=1 Tax=Geotrypetes seraphini TaxID=260995 RepID=A0A6P8SUL7_GEOSA|nr:uncharacterized protein LOC117369369 isoform X2 [Geotrypetes seraphini]
MITLQDEVPSAGVDVPSSQRPERERAVHGEPPGVMAQQGSGEAVAGDAREPSAERAVAADGAVDLLAGVRDPPLQVSAPCSGSTPGRHTDARRFMGPGQDEVWEMLRLSVAASTWTHYCAGFRMVTAFLESRGWVSGSVSEALLVDHCFPGLFCVDRGPLLYTSGGGAGTYPPRWPSFRIGAPGSPCFLVGAAGNALATASSSDGSPAF